MDCLGKACSLNFANILLLHCYLVTGLLFPGAGVPTRTAIPTNAKITMAVMNVKVVWSFIIFFSLRCTHCSYILFAELVA